MLRSWLSIGCGILAGDVPFADERSRPEATVRMAISALSSCWSECRLTALSPGQGKPFQIQVWLGRKHLCSYITVHYLLSVWNEISGVCFSLLALCLLVRLGGPLPENNNCWGWLKICNVLPSEKNIKLYFLIEVTIWIVCIEIWISILETQTGEGIGSAQHL